MDIAYKYKKYKSKYLKEKYSQKYNLTPSKRNELLSYISGGAEHFDRKDLEHWAFGGEGTENKLIEARLRVLKKYIDQGILTRCNVDNEKDLLNEIRKTGKRYVIRMSTTVPGTLTISIITKNNKIINTRHQIYENGQIQSYGNKNNYLNTNDMLNGVMEFCNRLE